MNEYQLNLFNDLETLIIINEAFYRQEVIKDGRIYYIYNYRLASYTDFLAPSALEARGTMFEVDKNGNAIRLAAWPCHKFFNRFENPSTMDIDLTDVDNIEVKSDGSLISTYYHNVGDGYVLQLKTKGSLFSDQAIAAMEWLETQPEMYNYLDALTARYATVNLEWTSPENRIVLGYQEPRLILLNVRDNFDGTYFNMSSTMSWIKSFMSEPVDLKGLSKQEFIEQIPDMQEDIEGFVVKMKSGLWMKIKTKKYLALHKCKDSINNPRRLFEAIIEEGIDDVRSIFHEDVWLINRIDEMQRIVDSIFNHMVKTVEGFYEENKHLDRKEYAIAGQQEVEPIYFGLVMNKYLNRPDNYKEFLKKNFKHFGIKDENLNPVNVEEE